MIIGIKINSFNNTLHVYDIINNPDVSEVHFFYDNVKYKDSLLDILSNKLSSKKKIYIHINDINDLLLKDVYKYNEFECIVVLNYESKIFRNEKYNPMLITYIDRLLVVFKNYTDIFDIKQKYSKATSYYRLRNCYNFNIDFNIDYFEDIDAYINFFDMAHQTKDTYITDYVMLNILSIFDMLNNKKLLYILPYNKFYYDMRVDKIYYDNMEFEYNSNIKELYNNLFKINDECENCNVSFFCSKYNVNCNNCKKFYSFFSNYIVKRSEQLLNLDDD